MSLFELFLLAVGLSMDAFAVSVCKGLSLGKIKLRHCAVCGIWFGGFQALMPMAGFFLGSQFADYITSFDHWIAFILLVAIGANMIREAFGDEDENEKASSASLAFGTMLVLAVATSIDALAVGISFAFLDVNILYAALFIGVTTFILSAVGVKVGSVFGSKYEKRAEVAGGIILVCLGIKILLEHLGVINF